MMSSDSHTFDLEIQAYKEQISAQNKLLQEYQESLIEQTQHINILENDIQYYISQSNTDAFDEFFDMAPSNLLILDRHATIKHVNKKAQEFFERSSHELVDLSFRSLLAKSSFQDFSTLFQSIEEKEKGFGDYLQFKDQSYFTIYIHKKPPTKKQKELYICCILSLDLQNPNFSDHLAKLALDQMHEGVVITDLSGKIIRVNNAFSEITGYSAELVINRKVSLLQSGRHTKKFYKKLWDSIVHHGWWSGEIWNKRKNGQVYPEWLQINKIYDPLTHKKYYIGTFSDISERKQNQERLDKLAHYDQLTGLMNRHFVKVSLQNLIDRIKDSEKFFAVLFIDLDNFKQINDQYGHQEGDMLLQEASQRILASVRQNDLVGRIGGDEFIVALTRLSELDDAMDIAQKIISFVSEPYQIDNRVHHIGASVGIANYPQHGLNIHDLMRRADAAMYRAKNDGRGKFSVFSEHDEKGLISYENTKNLIRWTLEEANSNLELHYQPLFDPKSHKLLSLEALARLKDDEGNYIAPDIFIEIAENENLIVTLGDKLFEMACKFLQELKLKKLQRPSIAINLSVIQLSDHDLFRRFKEIAGSYQHHLSEFSFEVTETSAMQNLNTILHTIHQFRTDGCSIMLDDFGTGYASLSQLYNLPIDIIKIDKSFTDLIDSQDDSHAKFVRAILSMAEAFDIEIIIEGVETQAQLEWIQQYKVGRVQGYHFSKPLKPEDLIKTYLR